MRRCAGLWEALDRRPGQREEGASARRSAVSPWPPQVTPRRSVSLPLTARRRPLARNSPVPRAQVPLSSLRSADNSWMERVASDTSGTTRAGKGRTASRRSQEWRRRCADECGARGTVSAPVACRLPRGCAEAARSLGVPQRCDGVSAAEGAWRGAVSTHLSGQGSGP